MDKPNTTMPIIATAAKASNLSIVKTLFTTVPHFVPSAFKPEITQMQSKATSLSAQRGVVSFGCKERKRMRLMYSAKMMAMIAAPPGFKVVMAVQEKRNAHRGPKM
jgi:hypothetical protein